MASRKRCSEADRQAGQSNRPTSQSKEPAATARGGRRPAVEEIKEIFHQANSTLTFKPIVEGVWRQLTIRLVEEENLGLREAEKETGNHMLEEYLSSPRRC